MSAPDLATSTVWMRAGTEFLLERLDAADLAAPSSLPGWSNAHVAAHVARNADALLRLLHWARTGEERLMYPSLEARNAEIERDAGRDPQVQRADVRATAAALDDSVASTSARAWSAQIRSTRRVIVASEVPWMRVKEVWLHAVDLGAPAAELPPDVATALIDDIADSFSARADVPPVRLVDSGSGRTVHLGVGGPTVSGPSPALAAWLAGRSTGAGLDCSSGLPTLPAWL